MDIDDLTDDDRKQLAKDLAAELDTGLYGNRAVLSRRQLLTLAGGVGGVAGLVALGVDPATAQSAAGQVGTEASPEDVFAFDLDVQNGAEFNGNDLTGVGSLSTERGDITEAQRISDDLYAGTEQYPTIQDALGAIETKDETARFSDMALQEVILPPLANDRHETVDIDQKHTALKGTSGQSVFISDDADDHIIEMTNNDIVLEHIGASHKGSGNYDAFHATNESVDEAEFWHCACDDAPRYGFNITMPHSHCVGVEATGGDVAAFRFGARHGRVSNLKVQNPPAIGVLVNNESYTRLDGIIQNPGTHGLVIEGNVGGGHRYDVTVNGAGGDAVRVDGLINSRFDIVEFGSTDRALYIDDCDDCTIDIQAESVVELSSNATDITIRGRCGGLTDNGSNNDTSDLTI